MFGFFKKKTTPAVATPTISEPPPRDMVVDAVLLSGVVLPPYPAILEEMDALIAHEDFAVNQLTVLIARDPSLTAALLRVANSPVFGLRQSVTRLSQALSVLGLGRVESIMRSEVLRDTLKDYGDPALLHTLWQRFGNIGKMAACMASHSTHLKSRADLAYTLGMFHGTGCFIIAKRFPTEMAVLKQPGLDFEATMLQLNHQLKTDHTSISGRVARSWRLPPDVVEAITKQRIWQQMTGVAGALGCLLRITMLLHDHQEDGDEWAALWPHAQKTLGIDESVLDVVRDLMTSA